MITLFSLSFFLVRLRPGEELELIVAVFNYAGAGTLDAQLEAGRTPRKGRVGRWFSYGGFHKKRGSPQFSLFVVVIQNRCGPNSQFMDGL